MHTFLFGFEVFINYGTGTSGIWWHKDAADITLNVGKFEMIVSLDRRKPRALLG